MCDFTAFTTYEDACIRYRAACFAAQMACDAYSAALKAAYGREACNARYDERGQAESVRPSRDAFLKASADMHLAFEDTLAARRSLPETH